MSSDSYMLDKVDIWLAFGNHIFHRKYFVEIYEELSKLEVNWYITKEKSGAPAHPLYQKNTSELNTFDKIDEFIKELKK